MIIDFTIKNFRSVKDETLLSMHVEHPKKHLSDHVAYPADGKIGVLRAVGIYGANASGKSNILSALDTLQNLVTFSGDLKEGDVIPWYDPYRLSSSTKGAPTTFEIEFFNIDGVRYQYVISFDEKSILEESLDFFPSRQKANIFRRAEGDTWETISFGGLYKGGYRKVPFFKNNSYLSKAGNNASTSEMIRSVYNYFRKNLILISSGSHFFIGAEQSESEMAQISAFLCSVDTGISHIKRKKNEKNDLLKFPDGFPDDLKQALIRKGEFTNLFLHKNEFGGFEEFEEGRESDGTQKLFSMLPILIHFIKSGGVIVMDELDNSFHPHIAELIIKLFNDPEVNANNAQLIFSTHNIQLMSPERLRRDQIWFTQKVDGRTELYSLDSFDKSQIKSASPFREWYDEGRFGALPSINYQAIVESFDPERKKMLDGVNIQQGKSA